jgi:hypothetical protein
MLRITRDKAKLGDTPFITFTVYRTPKDSTTVCGYHEFAYQVAEDKVRFLQTPLGIPVAQAFEETRRFAEAKGISAIWINDPNRLFKLKQP